ncbi:HAD superfamily hydrolase (TIGR01509 family) [Micromonospora polyrhachis]|uniref:HAD superfamily hydrolase (TIGR01509 family) n=1 Tax=Micromonospora polyrhachis TaxID=1282883 RepID=A0A7W7SW87_9ACTN|nr:HAD superfamily hydrolase (TIGR01509 family) [Micromonospora polyrhachis]
MTGVSRPVDPVGKSAGPAQEDTLTIHPAAVLFDMDGTLIDSERIWEVALRELAASYGGRLSQDARLAMIGSSMANSMAILHEDLGQPWRDPTVGAAWLEQRVAELFVDELRWRPGALALLEAVCAARIPTALVTSTTRPLVEVALDTLGRDRFDIVVCGDEVSAPKPDPAPYLTAAQLLNVPIERCVAIEDSPAGVASGLAAGAAVLAVPGDVPLDVADGVHLVESLANADLALLGRLLTPLDLRP